ncbi:MAG: hypothetical protein P8Z41_07635 [Anaerolineales bacterium]|jgi:hypothetical protein
MRKHISILVLLMTLLLGACGRNETPEATATTAPEPIVEVPPTPTEDPVFQALQAYLGSWSGEWHNITFGSSGAVSATVSADEEGTLTISLDLDGSVFGASDPDPVIYSGNFDAEGAVFTIPGDPLFGDLTITITEYGEVVIVGESVPDERIDKVSAVGTVTPEEISLEYIVAFTTGDSAVGDLTLTKDS